MDFWEEKYVGKIHCVGLKFPEKDFIRLKSVHGSNLACYRFHHDFPKGLVFTFHGMHMSSYDWSYIAKALHNSGYTVASFDQEGHGNSEGERGTVRRFEDLGESCAAFIKKTKSLYPEGVPIFCIGLSMGGALSVLTALNEPELIKGIILLSPSLSVNPNFHPFLKKVVSFLNICCCSNLGLTKIDQSLVCRNSSFEGYFNDNPEYYHGKVDVKTAYAFISGFSRLQERINRLRCSILVFVGEQDNVADINYVKQFVVSCESKDKEITVYPDMHHCATHEPEFPEILGKIIEWLNNRV